MAELKGQVAELKARLNQNSSNSSRPPSSDPPSVKRAPPKRPTGKKRGGQRGHKRHRRDLVPPEKVTASFDIKPETCRCCGAALFGEDPEPLRHQVAELPPIEPDVTEYRLHRLLSVVATARQQNRNVLELLTACCRARLDGSAAPSLLPATAEVAAA